jgi:hypothetical protein
LDIPQYMGVKSFNIDSLEPFYSKEGELTPHFPMPKRNSEEFEVKRIISHVDRRRKPLGSRYRFDIEYEDGDVNSNVHVRELKHLDLFKRYVRDNDLPEALIAPEP